MSETTRELKVQEYNTAAALLAGGATFLRAENGGRRVTLVFDDAEGEASRLLQSHRAGNLTLPTLQYAAALTETKNQIFAAKD